MKLICIPYGADNKKPFKGKEEEEEGGGCAVVREKNRETDPMTLDLITR